MRRVAAVLRFIARELWLVAVAAIGFVVVAAGLVMLITPGPGLLVIVAGLAILSTHFAWAAKALDLAKARATQAKDAASRRAAARRRMPPKSPPEPF